MTNSDGNELDYGMRVYDSRIGRFLSLDPLQKNYPALTPYQFSSNSPLANIDLDGLESSTAGKVYSDGPDPNPKYVGGAIIKRSVKRDAESEFMFSFLRTLYHGLAATSEILGQMEYGDRVRKENQASTFPLTHEMRCQ